MWDERSTTVTAHNMMNDVNKRGKERKKVIDAVAAAVILRIILTIRQIYLQGKRQSRKKRNVRINRLVVLYQSVSFI